MSKGDIKIKINTVMARKDIMSLADKLGPQQTDRAVASALNRVSAMGKTVASREIRGRYRITKKMLDARMGTTKAGARHLRSTIWSQGAPLPLRLFKYRQVKKGVKVTVTGRPTLIPGAFVATMKNGHRGVFARGRYDGSGFRFRKNRLSKGNSKRMLQKNVKSDLPITAMHTVSQGPMFSHPTVIAPVVDQIERMLPIRIEHELNYLLSKVK